MKKPQQWKIVHQGAGRHWKVASGIRLCEIRNVRPSTPQEFNLPTFPATACVIRKVIKGFQVSGSIYTCNNSGLATAFPFVMSLILKWFFSKILTLPDNQLSAGNYLGLPGFLHCFWKILWLSCTRVGFSVGKAVLACPSVPLSMSLNRHLKSLLCQISSPHLLFSSV